MSGPFEAQGHVRSIHFEAPPTAYTRHQLHAEQVCKPKEGSRLSVRIGVDPRGLHCRGIAEKSIKQVGPLIGARQDKVSEVGNVIRPNVAVSDTAGLSVADVVGGLDVIVPSGDEAPIGRDFVAGSSYCR